MKIALIGAGFVGSLLTEEAVKRFAAFEERTEWHIFDDDEIDERNPTNHVYTERDVGKPKALVLAERITQHYFTYANAVAHVERVTDETLGQLNDYDIVIDAVDNLPTRQMLWKLGVRGTPVLHIGVSQNGTGVVEWTLGEYDTFSLSPIQLREKSAEQLTAIGTVEKLKPCDLIGHRGVGLNAALCAAKALALTAAFDGERHLERGKKALTTWDITNSGHTLREVRDVA